MLAVGLNIFGATTSRFSATSGINGAARAKASREENVTILVNSMIVVIVYNVDKDGEGTGSLNEEGGKSLT